MKTKKIKPSQLISFDEIKNLADIHENWVHIKPNDYAWYKKDGFYFPHRKPTISEIIKNEFI